MILRNEGSSILYSTEYMHSLAYLPFPLCIRQSSPGHGHEVLHKVHLVLIRAHKDNLQLVTIGSLLEPLVPFGEERGELLARRTPVAREINAHNLPLSSQLRHWYLLQRVAADNNLAEYRNERVLCRIYFSSFGHTAVSVSLSFAEAVKLDGDGLSFCSPEHIRAEANEVSLTSRNWQVWRLVLVSKAQGRGKH